MPQFHEICSGHIPGLRLPFSTWRALAADQILTLAELIAVADGIERSPGIGTRSAQLIRLELARIAGEDIARKAA
jgi:hypothetical protein